MIKGVAVKLLIGIFTSIFVLSVVAGRSHIDALTLLAEAKQLTAVGKYTDAVNKLNLAEAKFSLPETHSKIEKELSDNQLLVSSTELFERGRILYEAGKYEDAIKFLNSVLVGDVHYGSAQDYKGLAESKTRQLVPTVTSAKTQVDTVQETPQPHPLQAKPSVDQGKLAALKSAVNAAAEQKAFAVYSQEQLNKYKLEQLKCSDRYNSSTFPGTDTIMSPTQHDSLVSTCMSGYDSIISDYQRKYDSANYQYNEYYRQINELLATCPDCASNLK